MARAGFSSASVQIERASAASIHRSKGVCFMSASFPRVRMILVRQLWPHLEEPSVNYFTHADFFEELGCEAGALRGVALQMQSEGPPSAGRVSALCDKQCRELRIVHRATDR